MFTAVTRTAGFEFATHNNTDTTTTYHLVADAVLPFHWLFQYSAPNTHLPMTSTMNETHNGATPPVYIAAVPAAPIRNILGLRQDVRLIRSRHTRSHSGHLNSHYATRVQAQGSWPPARCQKKKPKTCIAVEKRFQPKSSLLQTNNEAQGLKNSS